MFTLIAAGMAETGNAPEKFGETRDLVSFGKFGFKSQSRRITFYLIPLGNTLIILLFLGQNLS